MANLTQGQHSDLICQICAKKVHYNRHNESWFPSIQGQNRLGYKSKKPAANVVWYPDSRAIDHITTYIQDIKITYLNPSTTSVIIANGKEIPIVNTGNSSFSLGSTNIHLQNILHVPQVKRNLLSSLQ